MSSSNTCLTDWWKSRNFHCSVKPKTPNSGALSPFACTEGLVVNSPVTELALTIGDLSTTCDSHLPRRKLLLGTDVETGRFCRQESADEGCSFELENQPVEISNIGQDSGTNCRRNTSFKKFKSLPLSFYGFLPIGKSKSKVLSDAKKVPVLKTAETAGPDEREDESSQDSGLGLDKDDFKVPRLPLSVLSKTNLLNSTPRNVFSKSRARVSLFRSFSLPCNDLPNSPVFLVQNESQLRQNAALMRDENCDGEDDGFIDMVDIINPCSESGVQDITVAETTCTVSIQKSGKVPHHPSKKRQRTISTGDSQPENAVLLTPTRRNLFSLSRSRLDRSKSLNSGATGHLDCHDNGEGPFDRSKRHKASDTESLLIPASVALSIAPVRRLVRCQSEAMIKSALLKSDGHGGDLIGDFSQSYCLPLTCSKHQDLKAISSNTMSRILNNEFFGCLPKYFIVDCRYPYEFDAGHLKGALNIFSKEAIVQEFFSPEAVRSANSTIKRRPVIIFHCEFSSERGPKLMRFLRNTDRECNKDCYPALHYPELYLLEGGYKAFFQMHPKLCEPHGYKPMLHEDHTDEMKHFRSRSRNLDVGNLTKSFRFSDA